MDLIIHVEGDTEKRFVDRLLKPYLSDKYHVIPIINKTSVGHFGGLSHYKQFRKNTRQLCRKSECLLTTMLDLYHLPTDFPGQNDAELPSDAEQRVKYLEEKMKEDLAIQPPTYFIPYIQLHEFEALLFSDIEIVDKVLRVNSCSDKPALQSIMKRYNDKPEMINTDEGPSVKLDKISKRQYKKIVHGIDIAEKITIDRMRERCPHFDQWLKQLEDFMR